MEIKEYWPRHLQELVEFGQIATAEQPEFTKAVQDVQGAPDDFFLVSLSPNMAVGAGKRFWALWRPQKTPSNPDAKES